MALERHIDRGDHDLQLAVQSHRAGNLAHAEQIYRRILSGDPCHCDALHLLGVIAHQQGKNERALTLIPSGWDRGTYQDWEMFTLL